METGAWLCRSLGYMEIPHGLRLISTVFWKASVSKMIAIPAVHDCVWLAPVAIEICDLKAAQEVLRVGHVHVICPVCGQDLSLPCHQTGMAVRPESTIPPPSFTTRRFRRRRDAR